MRIINYAPTKKDVCKFATMQQIRTPKKEEKIKNAANLAELQPSPHSFKTFPN
jgi:hypothetical protein